MNNWKFVDCPSCSTLLVDNSRPASIYYSIYALVARLRASVSWESSMDRRDVRNCLFYEPGTPEVRFRAQAVAIIKRKIKNDSFIVLKISRKMMYSGSV
jgi:hypothetical protein